MARKRLDVSQLDFDKIKDSYKEFLRDQDLFTDFDLEGSGMSIILDVLSLNAHHMGYYSNMAVNEAFIDSAATRRSITSIAKHLGYTPRSVQSATAQVDINFGSTQPSIGGNSIDYLPTGTPFRATFSGDVFSFITKKPYKIEYNDTNSVWEIKDVVISEGVLQLQNFIYNSDGESDQKFIFNNGKIDTSSLVVRVQNSISDQTGFTETWNRSTNFSSLNTESRVYFIEENKDGIFQMYFADGIIGRKLVGGNYITVQYLETRGVAANGIGNTDSTSLRTFTISGFQNAVVSVTSSASGGSTFETSESIRFNAPHSYQAQDRAVTAHDYRTIVNENYGEADSVFVYGGEDADPPQFGKVFVSIKPSEGTFLTDLEKADIARNVLANQNVLGITPEVIDPDYIYLKITTNVTYDPTLTSLTETGVESSIANVIQTYADTELEKFDKNFYFSAFTGYIDDSHPSVLGNQTSVILEKRLPLQLNETKAYEINFNNAVFHPEAGYKPVLESETFTMEDSSGNTISAFLDDDGNGNIRIYKLVNDTKVVVNSTIGTINYTTGKIALINFKPVTTGNKDAVLNISIVPHNQDVSTIRNMILLIDSDDVTVDSTQKTIVNPNSLSGNPFPFNT